MLNNNESPVFHSLKERLLQKKQKRTEHDNKDEGEECSICYDVIKPGYGNRGKLDSCEHMFCFECIDEWRKKGSNSCPMCKRKFYRIVANVTPEKVLKNGKKRKMQKVIEIKKSGDKRRHLETVPSTVEFDFESEEEESSSDDDDYVYGGTLQRYGSARVTRAQASASIQPRSQMQVASSCSYPRQSNFTERVTRHHQRQHQPQIVASNFDEDLLQAWSQLESSSTSSTNGSSSRRSNRSTATNSRANASYETFPTELSQVSAGGSRRNRRGMSLFGRVAPRSNSTRTSTEVDIIDLCSDHSDGDGDGYDNHGSSVSSNTSSSDQRRFSVVSLSDSSTCSEDKEVEEEFSFQLLRSHARLELDTTATHTSTLSSASSSASSSSSSSTAAAGPSHRGERQEFMTLRERIQRKDQKKQRPVIYDIE